MTAMPPKWTPAPLASIPTDLPYSDGIPMDSPWHCSQMVLLIQSLESRWKGRKDFYCGGNMFIYYNAEQARNRDFLGPDFFVVLNTDHDRRRHYWAVWEESRMPDVIVELLSPTTAEEDRTTKMQIYERQFQTSEYFLYDPSTQILEGYRRVKKRYQPMEPEDGRLWSEQLKCWLGPWSGKFDARENDWVRFFEPDGTLVLNGEEREAQRANTEKQKARAEKQKTQAEKQKTQAEKQRAEAEKHRAEAEKQRADTAEAELTRLKAELELLRKTGAP